MRAEDAMAIYLSKGWMHPVDDVHIAAVFKGTYESFDWGRLLGISAANRLLPIVSQRILNSVLTKLSVDGVLVMAPYVRQAFQAFASENEARNQVLYIALSEAVETLSSVGIQFVVRKGVPLEERVYARPGMRIMNDIDLLVPKGSVGDAVEALQQAGFKRDRLPRRLELMLALSPVAAVLSRPAPFSSAGRMKIEISTRLTPLRSEVVPEAEEVIDRSCQVLTPAGEIPALNVADAVVDQALNFLEDAKSVTSAMLGKDLTLSRICEFDALVRGMAAGDALNLADSMRGSAFVAKSVALAMAFASEVLETAWPAHCSPPQTAGKNEVMEIGSIEGLSASWPHDCLEALLFDSGRRWKLNHRTELADAMTDTVEISELA